MPLVHVYWNDEKVLPEDVHHIVATLPTLVSEAFDGEGLDPFPGAEVTVKEFRCSMEVVFEGLHQLHGTPMSHDIEIIIWATYSDRRQAARAEIASRVLERLRSLVPESCSGFVWLLLQPTAFVDFSNGTKAKQG